MRRLPERLLVTLAWLSAFVVLSAVGVFMGFLLYRGAGSMGLGLLFGNVPVLDALLGRIPVWRGVWPAVAGTVCLVVLSSAMAIPLGLASGVYLAEYAGGRWKRFLSAAVDLLAGAPSIIMGLFGFALILFLRKTFLPQANVCLGLASVCLALLVLPYMTRTTQVALEGLPESIRLVGPSLGFSRWANIQSVLLPASLRGLLSGVILSVGRAAEDTAVILLTGVVANAGLPAGLGDKFEALPFTIYYLAAEHRSPQELDRGFGAALLLLLVTASLFAGARSMRRSLERGRP